MCDPCSLFKYNLQYIVMRKAWVGFEPSPLQWQCSALPVELSGQLGTGHFVGQWLACRWWVWFYLIPYYVMLIDESQVFELHIERKFEVCTTIQTSFLSTVPMHEFHASTSYTFNNIIYTFILTIIIPWTQMGSESIAHEADGCVICNRNYCCFLLSQVFLAKNKQEDQFYAIKVLNKAAIRKRNEVCQVCFKFTSCM